MLLLSLVAVPLFKLADVLLLNPSDVPLPKPVSVPRISDNVPLIPADIPLVLTGERRVKKPFTSAGNYDITHLSADGAAPLLSIRKGGGLMKYKLLTVLVIVLILANYVMMLLSLIAVIMALS